jgi:AraC-like DNA-binding protein
MYRLARTFKAEVGLAPHAYQIQLRVLRAKQMLAAGCRIAEAADECGFYDQAHLTDQFKRHVGVTPGGYSHGTADRGDRGTLGPFTLRRDLRQRPGPDPVHMVRRQPGASAPGPAFFAAGRADLGD